MEVNIVLYNVKQFLWMKKVIEHPEGIELKIKWVRQGKISNKYVQVSFYVFITCFASNRFKLKRSIFNKKRFKEKKRRILIKGAKAGVGVMSAREKFRWFSLALIVLWRLRCSRRMRFRSNRKAKRMRRRTSLSLSQSCYACVL